MRAEMLGLAAQRADPDPAAKELVAGVLTQTAINTAEIKRLEGSVQHMHNGSRAAENAVGRALKLLHAQVISKPGREELEQASRGVTCVTGVTGVRGGRWSRSMPLTHGHRTVRNASVRLCWMTST